MIWSGKNNLLLFSRFRHSFDQTYSPLLLIRYGLSTLPYFLCSFVWCSVLLAALCCSVNGVWLFEIVCKCCCMWQQGMQPLNISVQQQPIFSYYFQSRVERFKIVQLIANSPAFPLPALVRCFWCDVFAVCLVLVHNSKLSSW